MTPDPTRRIVVHLRDLKSEGVTRVWSTGNAGVILRVPFAAGPVLTVPSTHYRDTLTGISLKLPESEIAALQLAGVPLKVVP